MTDVERDRPMEVWAMLPFYTIDQIRRITPMLEAIGVHGIAIPDHVCVPADISSIYPFTGRAASIPISTSFPDPLVAATIVGEHSSHLRIMTSILIAPLRDPVLLSRDVATVANATGDRFELGVGVGWLAEEYEALGIPFASRGQRLDEMLDLMNRLWSGDGVSATGTHFAFGPLSVNPKPARTVRVLIGGHSAAAIRRACRHGGWIGGPAPLDDVSRLVGNLKAELAELGLDRRRFRIRTGIKGRLTPELVGATADLGVDGLIVNPWQVMDGSDSIYEPSIDAFVDGLQLLMSSIAASTRIKEGAT